uniref:Putative ribosomal protein 63 mitochondrial isoform x1 n=1 Tax=Hyalomma excavatum TaxID=257692 RepID=A0A131XRF5_9ACAR
MRLTDVLLGVFKRRGFGGPRFHFVKHIPGKIDIGKRRIVPPVTPRMRLQLWMKLAVEEETMMYLSRPFLTVEEEKNMPKEFVRRRLRKYDHVPVRQRKPLKSLFASDLLSHLNVGRQWEE